MSKQVLNEKLQENVQVKSEKIVFSDEQSRVINSPSDSNILVVAGAGSGKTFTMTQRVIALINQGVAPESILGLTFTNKAASELLSRVSGAVSKSSSNSFLKPEVMTYDSFFQSIVRKYGILIGFSQNVIPLSDAGAYELIKSVVGNYLDKNSASLDLYSSDCVISLYNFNSLCKDVLSLYSNIACSMIGVDSQGHVCDSVVQAVDKIRAWNNDFLQFMNKIVENKTLEENSSSDIAIPKYSKAKSKSVEEKNELFKKACNKFEKYWENACVEESMNIISAAKKRNILLDLVLDFDKAKHKANMAQFSDFTIAAYRLVTHFPSIAIQYREQYKQVLLDEYQDTSTTQSMLINRLFHDNNTDICKDGIVNKNETYVTAVGDPFQAIYGFRGASSGAFIAFKNSFKSKAAKNLSSDASTLNPVNDFKSNLSECSLTTTRRNAHLILKLANDLTKPMRDSELQNKSSVEYREVDVEVLKPMDNATLGTVAAVVMPTKYQEIEAVVRFAKLFSDPTLTPFPADENRNPLKPRVAILFRSKLSMPLYADALRSAGLKVSVVGCSSVKEDPCVKDVLALLNVVNDHSCSSSLMRLLATPRFSLSAKDLKTLANIANDANIKYKYDIYVQAGLLPSGLSGAEMIKAVKNQRANSSHSSSQNSIDNGVFLADIFMQNIPENPFKYKNKSGIKDNNSSENSSDSNNSNSINNSNNTVCELYNKLSKHGYAVVRRVSDMLQTVTRACNNSLNDVMRVAVEALNVDIDSAVASCIKDDCINRENVLRAMHSTLDSLNSITDTYIQEMGEWQKPSLKGLMSWIESSDDFDSADSIEDDNAQVVMMTVHQSKGLQWPAVAVVGLNAKKFPSSQGDNLSFSADSDDDVEYIDNLKRSGSDLIFDSSLLASSAHVPIEYASSVPVPLRVDSGNLPHFPHDATLSSGMHPLESLKKYDSVEKIYDEIKTNHRVALRALAKYVYESDAIESGVDLDQFLSDDTKEIYRNNCDILTQSEERGNQLHMEERHLLYVAMTRAQFATMLTCARTTQMSSEDAKSDMKLSVFMKEALSSLYNMKSDCESSKSNNSNDKTSEYKKIILKKSDDSKLDDVKSADSKSDDVKSADVKLDDAEDEVCNESDSNFGIAVGEYASKLADVLQERTNQPTSIGNTVLPWPITLSKDLEDTLNESVRLMKSNIDDSSSDSSDSSSDSSLCSSSDSDSSSGSSCSNSCNLEDLSLTNRVKMFISDSDFGLKNYNSNKDLAEYVRQKAKDYEKNNSKALSITTLQRSAKISDSSNKSNSRDIDRRMLAYIRPIPSVSTINSDMGTKFHEWAESFVNAGNLEMSNFAKNDSSVSGESSVSSKSSVSSDSSNPSEFGSSTYSSSAILDSYDDFSDSMISRIDVQLSILAHFVSESEVCALAERNNLTDSQQALADSLANSVADCDNAKNIALNNENNTNLVNCDISSLKLDDREDLLNIWKTRLVKSRWAKRVSLAAELPISYALESNGNNPRVLNGILDAVFLGGLNPKDTSKRFTVVDWKTGKKPTVKKEIERKLVQLDWYRLMLSAVTGAKLDEIDATLYYVSEENEESREIHALLKTEQQIRSELS